MGKISVWISRTYGRTRKITCMEKATMVAMLKRAHTVTGRSGRFLVTCQ